MSVPNVATSLEILRDPEEILFEDTSFGKLIPLHSCFRKKAWGLIKKEEKYCLGLNIKP